jgi:hypothetical protein
MQLDRIVPPNALIHGAHACDNSTFMWFVLIAALLAALMLIQSVGIEAAAALVIATAIAIVVWRQYRLRRPPAVPENYCLRCGASLPYTARSCNQCGSAAWSVKQ